MSRPERGFTLIELLIVVAIIGILAAIAIPNMLTAVQRARQKRTMASMRSVATAWETRATDVNSYRAAGAVSFYPVISTLELADMLRPTYLRAFPTADGWGNPFVYQSDVDGRDYLIMSHGKDNQFDSTHPGGPTTAFVSDIVFSNGVFVQYPEGVQTQ